MGRQLPLLVSAAAGFAALFAASAASAGCPNACPPPPCCNVPRTHQVNVPGIKISPPSVNIMTPSIAISGASASASASASAYGVSQGSSSSVVFAGGGGSGYYVDQGSTGVIQSLNVETETPAPICVAYRSEFRAVSIQAVCVDDKSVPHPASQVTPDRDIAETYEGEVFRCIAGSKLQYTLAPWMGKAGMEGGQTRACAKGEALYHTASGDLVCLPQKAARDCNERSLLRRYGAGIKVLKAKGAQVCASWSSETQTASMKGGMMVDGGVGGVVH